jgi:hypothetical protein
MFEYFTVQRAPGNIIAISGAWRFRFNTMKTTILHRVKELWAMCKEAGISSLDF